MVRPPIVIFAYNRVDRLRQLIRSLSNCNHVHDYDCYIFLDAANFKKENDCEKVTEVKKYIDSFIKESFFNDLFVIEAEYHKGLRQSVIDGVSMVIEEKGSVIVLEDDLVVGTGFLDYMNDALSYYRDDASIWSITANCDYIGALDNYQGDFFLSYRANSLGYGTWRDRWELIDWDVESYEKLFDDKKALAEFADSGYDLPETLTQQVNELNDSWAITWCYEGFRRGMWTVYPKRSMVSHMGAFGTHFDGQNLRQQTMQQEPFKYSFNNCAYDANVNREFSELYMTKSEWIQSNYGQAINKHSFFIRTYEKWLQYKEKGIKLSKFFAERGWRRIAIYGAGDMGKHLYEELKGTDIEVVGFVDKNKEGTLCGREIFCPEYSLPSVDVTVVTPIANYREIQKQLAKVNNKSLTVSLYRVLD